MEPGNEGKGPDKYLGQNPWDVWGVGCEEWKGGGLQSDWQLLSRNERELAGEKGRFVLSRSLIESRNMDIQGTVCLDGKVRRKGERLENG